MGAQQSSPYRYDALNASRKEIRLLLLQPAAAASHSCRVSCRLIHVSLLQKPLQEYEAVSYVWGDGSEQAVIQVDGKDLHVPSSADEVLQFLRWPDHPRVLWIDAVCINQQDIAERSSQVAIMGDIYRCSTQSLAYLAPKADGQDKIMSLLDEVLQYMQRDAAEFETYYNAGTPPGSKGMVLEQAIAYAEHFDPIIELIRRPWFRRLWVVQESILPPACRALFGDFERDINDIFHALIWLSTNCTMQACQGLSPPYQTAVTRRLIATDYATSFHLLSASAYETRDERDRLFAMLGLLRSPMRCEYDDQRPEIERMLVPDYTRSTADVYESATAANIVAHQHPEVLLNVCHTKTEQIESKEMASWAMHLDQELGTTLWRDLQGYYASHNLAETTSHKIPLPNSVDGQLRLIGMQLDRITLVVPALEDVAASGDSYLVLEQAMIVWRQARDALSEALPSMSKVDILITLIKESYDGRKTSPSEELVAGASAFVQLTDAMEANNWGLDEAAAVTLQDSQRPYIWQIVLGIWASSRHKSVFVTESGRMGIGSELTQSNDTIWIVARARMPFILRPAGESFRYVSDAYVHGIMSGAVVEELISKGEKPVEVGIK